MNAFSYIIHRKRFCKNYLKSIETVKGYEYYLKHLDKTEISQHFIHISIYDVVDNNGFAKVVRALYKLMNDPSFTVSTNYKKTSLLHRYDYISRTIFGRSAGIVGEVKFKKDNWITSIEIRHIHLSNSEIILEYRFSFKKVMKSYKQIHDFVVEKLKFVKKGAFFTSYIDKNFFNHARLIEYVELEIAFFEDILQSYITNMLYSNYGRTYLLPLEYHYLIKRYNKKVRNRLRNAVGYQCYEKNGEHILITDWPKRVTISVCSHGKYFPTTSVQQFLMYCSSEMYYMLFGKIEAQELEIHMRKYLNSRKRFINSKDIKWFIRKIRAIDEERTIIEETLSTRNKQYYDFLHGWTLFSKYNEADTQEIITFPYYCDYYRNLYSQNLEYINSIAAVQINSIVIWVTTITLIATIIGILFA